MTPALLGRMNPLRRSRENPEAVGSVAPCGGLAAQDIRPQPKQSARIGTLPDMPIDAAASRPTRVGRQNRDHLLGLALAALASVIWASSFFLIKQGIQYTDPVAFAGYRYLIGGIILVAVVILRRQSLAASRLAWVYAVICGILAYSVGQATLFVAQSLVTPLAGAFFFSLAPAFVLSINALVKRNIPTVCQLGGLATIVVGSLLFVRPGSLSQIPPVALGEFILSNIATASYLLLLRRALDKGIPGQWLAATSLVIGGTVLLATSPIMQRSLIVAGPSVVSLVWLATINTALAYGLYTKALSLVPPYEVSVITASIPLETAALTWVVFGKAIAGIQLAGILIVAVGIVAVQLGALASINRC
jgi:drug/metabolite transporter (DMT)-like permease